MSLGKTIEEEMIRLDSIDDNYLTRLSGLITYDRAYLSKNSEKQFFSKGALDSLRMPKMNRELKCLSEALYFEARGESVIGQFAVAEVIVNRANSSKFPDTVCGVVNQGTNKNRYKCQFTYMCDGLLESIDDKASYARAGKIAKMTLWDVKINLTNGALYYHAKSVNPSWAKKLVRTGIIGDHKFYSDNALVN